MSRTKVDSRWKDPYIEYVEEIQRLHKQGLITDSQLHWVKVNIPTQYGFEVLRQYLEGKQ